MKVLQVKRLDCQNDSLFYLTARLDPKSPKRLEINSHPGLVPYSKLAQKRLAFWESVFDRIPPRIHLKTSQTWAGKKTPTKSNKAPAEEQPDKKSDKTSGNSNKKTEL